MLVNKSFTNFKCNVYLLKYKYEYICNVSTLYYIITIFYFYFFYLKLNKNCYKIAHVFRLCTQYVSLYNTLLFIKFQHVLGFTRDNFCVFFKSSI